MKMTDMFRSMFMYQGDGGGGTPDPPADPPAADPPDPADAPTDPPADPPKEPDSLLGPKDGDEPGDGDVPKGDDDAKAPETYAAFEVPDGAVLTEEQVALATPVFKEMGLSQEQAQRVIDLQWANLEQQQEAWATQAKEWVGEVKGDPDMGGAEFSTNVERANAFVERVLGKEDAAALNDLLRSTGVGNFPPLFRFVHRVAGAVSEDSFPGTNRQQQSGQMSEQDKLRRDYPTMFNEDGTPKTAAS